MTYIVSYLRGPLDNRPGTVDSLDPISVPPSRGGGEYRFEEFGQDGDAVFMWHAPAPSSLRDAVLALLDRAREGFDADEEDLERALDAQPVETQGAEGESDG